MKPSELLRKKAFAREDASRFEALYDFLDLLVGEVDTPEKPLIPVGATLIRNITNPQGDEACAMPLGEPGKTRVCNQPAVQEIITRNGIERWDTEYRCETHAGKIQYTFQEKTPPAYLREKRVREALKRLKNHVLDKNYAPENVKNNWIFYRAIVDEIREIEAELGLNVTLPTELS